MVLCTLIAAFLFPAQAGDFERTFKAAAELAARGEYERAIPIYRAAITIRPDAVQVRSDLGVALARTGRYADAMSEYRAALQIAPDNSTIRLNLALALYKLGEYENAVAEFAGVHALDSGNRQALYLQGDCLLRLGRNLKVIDLMMPHFQKAPEDNAIAYMLGTALIRDGQIDRGQMVVDRILRQHHTAEAKLLVGAAQLAAGDHRAALESLRSAAAVNPALPTVWSLYGRAQIENGDNEGARQSFARALETDANDFDANLHLGALLRYNNAFEQAFVYIDKAIRLRPESLAARFQRGAINAEIGKLNDALNDLEYVAERSPLFQDVHVQLASVYFRLNRREDGQRERELVMKLNELERKQNRKKPAAISVP